MDHKITSQDVKAQIEEMLVIENKMIHNAAKPLNNPTFTFHNWYCKAFP